MSTIVEIEAKKTTLENTITTALEAAKALTPATAEFDEAYGRYLSAKAALAKIPEELANAMKQENAAAIKADADVAADAIFQLVEGLKVADKLGKPVECLRYFRVVATNDKGEENVSMGVVFNPVATVARAAKGDRKAGKGAGHNMIVCPDGTKLSLTKFVLAHATEAEKSTPEYKYPHSRVDSKPKFEKFCEEHGLTGYTYEMPTQADAEAG